MLDASVCDLTPESAFDGLSCPRLTTVSVSGNTRLLSLAGLVAACACPSLAGGAAACGPRLHTLDASDCGLSDVEPLARLPALVEAKVDKGVSVPTGWSAHECRWDDGVVTLKRAAV